ncbi:MAG: hypothetical protein R3338_03890 [Thermoanaerobaculia bacterium]|nr:hypothetical protein [Thermoanaerobaculia bacterium]
MTDCERYRNEPEAFAEHANTCEACRSWSGELDHLEAKVSTLSLDPKPEFSERVTRGLPLAPWEGAGYRSWGLVIAVLATLIILVSAAFLAVGVSPIMAARALGSTMVPLVSPFELARSFSAVIASGPVSFHVVIGVAFVVVNVALVLLLRRRPKGYDA